MNFQLETLETVAKEAKMKKKSLTKQTSRIFWQHAMQYRARVTLIFSGILLASLGDLTKPFLVGAMINGLVSGQPGRIQFSILLVFIIAGLGLLVQAIWRTVGRLHNDYQARVLSDLLNFCFEYVQDHSYGFFTKAFVGSLVAKIKRYAQAFETIDDQVKWNVSRTGLFIVGTIAVMAWYSWLYGLIMFSWCIIYVSFAYGFSRANLKYDIATAEVETQVTAQLSDSLTNNQNVKLFATSGSEARKFRGITDQLTVARKRSWNFYLRAEILQSFIMVTLECVIMYLAIRSWQRGSLTIGDIAALQTYLGQLFDHLWNLGRNLRQIYEHFGNANEATEMLLQPHEVVDAAGSPELVVRRGGVRFQDVSFGYHSDRALLHDFNLTIEPGERVALVGASGAGKSTLSRLLLRLYDVQSGAIFIDGQNVAQVQQDSLHRQVSLVPQDPILFHRSLRENISHGSESASEEQIVAAAKAAHCHEFISSFSQGYDTLVGERGIMLSGGERQRVAIARAILKNSPILILDEATSSLDSESELLIQEALEVLMAGKTVIAIAHRLSTIRNCDRIVVLGKNGEIVEEGSHDVLMQRENGVYRRYYDIQSRHVLDNLEDFNGTVN